MNSAVLFISIDPRCVPTFISVKVFMNRCWRNKTYYTNAIQGYLAHKKPPPPLGPPQGPGHRPTVGSWEESRCHERGTPVLLRVRSIRVVIFVTQKHLINTCTEFSLDIRGRIPWEKSRDAFHLTRFKVCTFQVELEAFQRMHVSSETLETFQGLGFHLKRFNVCTFQVNLKRFNVCAFQVQHLKRFRVWRFT